MNSGARHESDARAESEWNQRHRQFPLQDRLKAFPGGSLQIELTPIVTQTLGDTARFINHFSRVFFQKHGVQINLNIVDLKELKKAMDDPENPKYQDIVVKVTGYSAHFVAMDRKLQEEFVSRVNYVEG